MERDRERETEIFREAERQGEKERKKVREREKESSHNRERKRDTLLPFYQLLKIYLHIHTVKIKRLEIPYLGSTARQSKS